jgi:RimJ/RimL family protein N-acetyltransferase
LKITLRSINNKDIKLLYQWLNSHDSLHGKIQTKGIVSFLEHSKWFEKKLTEKKTHIWIVENYKKFPLGQIRFEKKVCDYLDVDIYIIKEARGKGVAQKALNIAENLVEKCILRAEVKKNNIVSYNFFLNCGFKVLKEDKTKWTFTKKK